MTVTVRSHTKLAAAFLAAGVVAAASPGWVPLAEKAAPVVSSQAVQSASVVTDLLFNFGTMVSGATTIVEAPIEAALWSPDYAFSTLVLSLRNPAIIGSLLSFVAQQYTNPLYGGFASYGVGGLTDITSVLPPPIGTWLTGAVNGTAGRIGSLLDALPDPTAGSDAFYDFVNNNFVGNIVDDINWLALAPLYSITATVRYLGYLPYDLEATLESALRYPSEIPGLLSNLVRGLVEPYNGLLGQIVDSFVAPLTYLPFVGAPIEAVYTAIANGVEKLLDLLPAPIAPTPFLATSSAAAASTALVSATLLAAAKAVTLDVPKTAEDVTPAADLDSKPDAVQDVKAKAPEVVVAEPVTEPADPAPVVDKQPAAEVNDGGAAEPDAKDSDVKDSDVKKGDDNDGATGRHHRRDNKVSQGADENKTAVRGSHRGAESGEAGGRHRADAKKDAPSAGAADPAGAGDKAEAAAA